MDSRRVRSRVNAGSNRPSPGGDPSSLPHSPAILELDAKQNARQEREKDAMQVVMRKVCEHCGKVFNKHGPYLFHVRSHRPVLNCDECNFSTRNGRKFRVHKAAHKRANPSEQVCNVCKARFWSEPVLKTHLRRIHGIIVCKDCNEGFIGEEVYANHRDEAHNDPALRQAYESREHVNIFKNPKPFKNDFLCHLCNKEFRNKYQLKIHIAQHLGVTSDKISDDFLANQDVDQFEQDNTPKSSKQQKRRSKSGSSVETSIGEYDHDSLSDSRAEESVIEGQSLTTSLNTSVKIEPPDLLHVDHCNPSFSGTSNEEFPFLGFPKVEPTDPIESSVPNNNPLPAPLQPHDLIATSVDTSILSLQQNMLRSLHSMIYPSANIMTTVPMASLPSTSYDYGAAWGSLPTHFISPDLTDTNKKSNHKGKLKVTPPKRCRQPKPKRIRLRLYCNECPSVFASHKALQKHQVKHRKEELRKAFTCPECELSCLSGHKMARHFKTAHRDKFRCRYRCALLFTTREEVFAHYKEVHKAQATGHPCPHCGMEYLMEGFLLNHLERCTKCPPEKRPVHVCGNCELVLRSSKEYKIHIRKCGGLKDELSSEYGDEFGESRRSTDTWESFEIEDSNQEAIEHASVISYQHVPNIIDEPFPMPEVIVKRFPYQCKYCKMGFDEMEHGVEHCFSSHLEQLKVMGIQPLVCPVCGMEFKYKTGFCKHVTKHYRDQDRADDLVPRNLMEIAYAVNYCWLCSCKIQGNIHTHINHRNKSIELFLESHKEPESSAFGCTYCLEHFKDRLGYWRHVKEHLKDLPFVEIEPFSRDGTASNSSQPWECSVCLLMFTDGVEFHKHLATHVIMFRGMRKSEGEEEAPEIEENEVPEIEANVVAENEERNEMPEVEVNQEMEETGIE